MPRSVQVVVPSDRCDDLVARLRPLKGVLGVIVQRGSSVEPPGDVIQLTATNDGTRRVLHVLDAEGIAESGSIATSELKALISSSNDRAEREPNETIWEEAAFLLRRETNVQVNFLALMLAAGMVAAVGLWTGTIHLVIGAMVLAPGFEPVLRVPLGFVAGPNRLAVAGLFSIAAGYAALGVGAAASFLIVRELTGEGPLAARGLVSYWSSVSGTSVLVAVVAAAAGAFVVAGQRSVLSAGVMIALGLVPSASIVGMAIAAGDAETAGGASVRWLTEVGLIALVSLVVLAGKQRLLQHRRSRD